MTKQTSDGVLMTSARLARAIWGVRLQASYALGSLVHGGFSATVSDIDFAVVLAGPLEDRDEGSIVELVRRVIDIEGPVAQRLSVMWGTTAPADDKARGLGRFPAVDRLDLLTHGKLLDGSDVRSSFATPCREELLRDTAEFALSRLATGASGELLRSAALLSQADVKRMTKLVLFPARFLFTAHSGSIGRNHESAAYVASLDLGSASVLVENAIAWRDSELPDAVTRHRLIAAGLGPLYWRFGHEYRARLVEAGESALAARLWRWTRGLGWTPVRSIAERDLA